MAPRSWHTVYFKVTKYSTEIPDEGMISTSPWEKMFRFTWFNICILIQNTISVLAVWLWKAKGGLVNPSLYGQQHQVILSLLWLWRGSCGLDTHSGHASFSHTYLSRASSKHEGSSWRIHDSYANQRPSRGLYNYREFLQLPECLDEALFKNAFIKYVSNIIRQTKENSVFFFYFLFGIVFLDTRWYFLPANQNMHLTTHMT